MVREAYSAGSPAQHADGAAATQPLDVRGSTANLTQELAQLLAQSIAQGQSGKRPPGAAATGSELASLAALVSASQNQRSQPYRDGLSSLSYARPAHSPPPAPMQAAAAPSLLVTEPHHEDEPMPIPSTWRQPTLSDDDRWYRQQLGAAALGLIAGLVVVVPAVLYLSFGWSQAKKAPRTPTAEQQPSVRMVDVKPVPVPVPAKVHVAASAGPRPAAVEEPPPGARSAPIPAPVPKAEPARSRADDLLEQAKRRIDKGDIPGAREILQTPETATSGPMTFMLAETYDPNMLAARGIRQPNIADNMRAKALYRKAHDLGEERAQQRLDWLN
jgi:hypothetical protein